MKKSEIKQLFPELLEEQTCECCGKKFYYSYKQIMARIKRKLKNEIIIISCSRKCTMQLLNSSEEQKEKCKQGCKAKYGVDNYAKTPECKDKYKKACMQKFGVDNYFKTDECKEKARKGQEKRRKPKKVIPINFQGLIEYLKTHKKATMQSLEIYFNAPDVQEILQKYHLTEKELRYRLHKDIPLDKIFTCKRCGKLLIFTHNGYGEFCSNLCANTFKNKSPEFKEKVRQVWLTNYGVETNLQLDTNKEKSAQTCRIKYDADRYTKSKAFQQRVPEIQEKIHNTKTQNNSYIISEDEKLAYQVLLTKFDKDDIIQQYKSKEYPYICDFYIKSLNLYIEFNGHWTHGKEPYDPNNPKHQKIVAFWEKKAEEVNFKKKKKRQYRSAIYVWTILDVKKRQTFINNKLNYKIFWNVEEVRNWINSLI